MSDEIKLIGSRLEDIIVCLHYKISVPSDILKGRDDIKSEAYIAVVFNNKDENWEYFINPRDVPCEDVFLNLFSTRGEEYDPPEIQLINKFRYGVYEMPEIPGVSIRSEEDIQNLENITNKVIEEARNKINKM